MAKRMVVGVDSDASDLRQIAAQLEDQMYEMIISESAGDTLSLIEKINPALIIVSIDLADMSYIEFCRQARAITTFPFLLLVNHIDVNVVFDALRIYADDFITKPLDAAELAVRVKYVLSRVPTWTQGHQQRIHVDDYLQIDFRHHTIYAGGTSHKLTPTQAHLLRLLIDNAGRVVENERLIAYVWPSQHVNTETLRVHIFRLRQKIEKDAKNPKYIRTQRHSGYIFDLWAQH
ncbi:MAG: hypothetical protein CUN54_02350 [Phototrophicales bacterium]|nr:MAG: hypothetical protein CUN54_02350 [Phototrophicales bacterium]